MFNHTIVAFSKVNKKALASTSIQDQRKSNNTTFKHWSTWTPQGSIQDLDSPFKNKDSELF